MRILGLNLSDASAEVVELSSSLLQRPTWTARLRVELPEGLVSNGVIHDVGQLASKLANQFRPGDLAMSIPEAQVYSRWLRFSSVTKLSDLKATVRQQAAQYFPFEAHEIAIDCVSAGKHGDTQDLFCVAVPHLVLNSYRELAQALRCNLVRLELESLSSARAALANLPAAGSILLLDIGARTTIASWFTHQGLRFSFNVPLAGQYFTEQLQQGLKLSPLEAERLKQKQGLSGKAEPILTSALEPLLKSMNEGISYVQSEWQLDTTAVVLMGGSSQLPKLATYLTEQLHVSAGLPTALPWQTTYGMVSASEQEGSYMLNAVGLALGELKAYRDWPTVNFLNTK